MSSPHDQDVDPSFVPEPDQAPHARDMRDPRVTLALRLLSHVDVQISHIRQLLQGYGSPPSEEELLRQEKSTLRLTNQATTLHGGKEIEGVFTGQSMIGSDGLTYAVPGNYASKSQLVEGDLLLCYERQDGSRLFKQTGPMERRRLQGHLLRDAVRGGWTAQCGEEIFRVLPQSVSFYKGQEGDEITVLAPASGPSEWAAVEYVRTQ